MRLTVVMLNESSANSINLSNSLAPGVGSCQCPSNARADWRLGPKAWAENLLDTGEMLESKSSFISGAITEATFRYIASQTM